MSVIEIESVEQFDELEGNHVLVDFTAKWCGPCKMMLPKVKKIAEGYPEITVCKVDADTQQELCERFQVQALPTFVFLMDGNEIHRVEGADYDGLVEMCDRLVTEE